MTSSKAWPGRRSRGAKNTYPFDIGPQVPWKIPLLLALPNARPCLSCPDNALLRGTSQDRGNCHPWCYDLVGYPYMGPVPNAIATNNCPSLEGSLAIRLQHARTRMLRCDWGGITEIEAALEQHCMRFKRPMSDE